MKENLNLMRRLIIIALFLLFGAVSVPAQPLLQPEGREVKVLVIPAQFSDVSFTVSRNGFQALADEAALYWKDQCPGWEFDFYVAPIISLPRPRAYYGGNDYHGSDRHPDKFVRDACTLSTGLDFSRFDVDGDGIIDHLILFYPDRDEADDAVQNADCLWSQFWRLSESDSGRWKSPDGVFVDTYALVSELGKTSTGYHKASIGTLCHELAHTFNLPDFYDTDYIQGGFSEGLWGSLSLMDKGNYNNYGKTPPNLTSVEMWLLGLSEGRKLHTGEETLRPIGESGDFLVLSTENDGEMFFFECRDNSGWDEYIGGRGLLIYHLDRSAGTIGGMDTRERWLSNRVNAFKGHQCVDLVEADPGVADEFTVAYSTGTLLEKVPRVFFPCGEINSFEPPAFSSWKGKASPLSLSDIRILEDGCVSFTVSGTDTPTRIVIDRCEVYQDAAIIQWRTDNTEDEVCHLRITSGPAVLADVDIAAWQRGHFAFVADALSPSTNYNMTVSVEDGAVSVERVFKTKSAIRGGVPYIYLGYVPRNDDGSFPPGVRLPLRLYNSPAGAEVLWTFNGERVECGPDGYFIAGSEGELRAEVFCPGSRKLTVSKTIIMR